MAAGFSSPKWRSLANSQVTQPPCMIPLKIRRSKGFVTPTQGVAWTPAVRTCNRPAVLPTLIVETVFLVHQQKCPAPKHKAAFLPAAKRERGNARGNVLVQQPHSWPTFRTSMTSSLLSLWLAVAVFEVFALLLESYCWYKQDPPLWSHILM